MADTVTPISAAQAVKLQATTAALAHVTGAEPVTAGEAGALLEECAVAVARLADVLHNIGDGMRHSLDTHEVVSDDGIDPSRSVIAGQVCLQVAADQLGQAVASMWDAHSRVAGLGIRGRRVVPGTRGEVIF